MNSDRIAKLHQLLERDPDDSFARYAVAMEYMGHDDAAAIGTLEDLLRRDEKYVPAYHQLGMLYARVNRAHDAHTILQKGISIARLQNEHHAAEEMEEAMRELL